MESVTDTGHCPDWLESCLNNDDELEISTRAIKDDKSPEERKGTYIRLRNASKPHSTPQTLKWYDIIIGKLEENYEIAEGVCIPRSTLYVHYLDFCEKHDTQPVNAASFGKIIRQQFPQLTTRRLGTRGQSKYHYYGIGVRETSEYYDIIYSAKGVQSSLDGKKDSSKQIIAYSPRSKLGTLLPDFPDIKDIKLPTAVSEDKVLTFMMMYRTHCQRILDTVIRANFDEVQNFLIHFWQGMPNHIKSILECKVLVTLVGVCDTILYRAIASVLMPTVLQPLPESLTQVIRRFSGQLDDWLHQALDSLPQSLQRVKFDLARRFSQVLRRQTSLNHLCQAARTVVHSPEITSQMLDDWINVDLNSITKQTLYTMDSYSDREHNVIVKLTREFEVLLEDQAPLESYIEWLDGMVDQCVIQKGTKQIGSLRKTARQFLLMWSCFGTRIIRDMTLHSAPSFGSFHLLHLMFDEYVLYMVESLHSQERGNELLRAVRGEQSLDFLDDILLSDTSASSADRGSVIRGPNSQPQHIEGFTNMTDFNNLNSLDTRDNCIAQQSVVYRDTSDLNIKNNGSYPDNQFPANNFYNQSTYSQNQTRSSISNVHHISTSAAVKGSSAVHPFLDAAKQAFTGSEVTPVNYWYDWSSRSTGCTGITGHVTNRSPSTETFQRQQISASCQTVQQQVSLNYDSSPGLSSYESYPSEIIPRRNNCDNPSLKRKLNQDVSAMHNKQLDDFYSYNIGSNLL